MLEVWQKAPREAKAGVFTQAKMESVQPKNTTLATWCGQTSQPNLFKFSLSHIKHLPSMPVVV